MKILKKHSISFLLVAMFSMLLIPMFSLTVGATNTAINQPNNGVTPINGNNGVTEQEISGDNQVPNVSIDDAKDLIERKTYDIVHLLQVFVKPFSAIIFVFCAIISLFGAVTRSGFVGKGLLGMFISGIMYTAVLYAPEIMNFFSNWLIS